MEILRGTAEFEPLRKQNFIYKIHEKERETERARFMEGLGHVCSFISTIMLGKDCYLRIGNQSTFVCSS